MGDVRTYTIRAEALSAKAFEPFGQVIDAGDTGDTMVMELRGEEVFHLNVLSYDRRPLRCDHLNRHHRATQALVALAGRPTLVLARCSSFLILLGRQSHRRRRLAADDGTDGFLTFWIVRRREQGAVL